MGEPVTLQGIMKHHLDDYSRTHSLDARRLAVCRHITDCRTAALGGLRLQCDHCGDNPIHYFSCRDRHCPQCQQRASRQWSEKQQQSLLPVTYFHLVFTLPETLNGWVRLHPEVIYRLLFRSVWETLRAFAAAPKRLGGELGMTAMLHTWGQNLSQHPHLHCLVPGGAVTGSGDWHPARSNYLFPVRALSRRFRGEMVSRIRRAVNAGEMPRVSEPGEPERTLERLMQQDWVVYSKPALAAPGTVLEYLSRYSHRTAIHNSRLVSMGDEGIRFRYKDYREQARWKVMRLSVEEFLRRFLMHVLPKGLMRIRHFGFLANSCRRRKLQVIRRALAAAPKSEVEVGDEVTPFSGYPCPRCHRGLLHVIGEQPPTRLEGG